MIETLTDDLQFHLDELEEHIAIASDRIKAYYRGEEPPDDFPAYEVPPHQQMLNRGISAVEFAFDYEAEGVRKLTTDWSVRDFEYSHLGVGLDLILQGIFLKCSPNRFIEKLEDNNGKTPNYSAARNHLLGVLSVEYSDQKEQIRLTLAVIRKHRNNSVHLGVHDVHHKSVIISSYEVAGYLISQYSEDNLELVRRIRQYREQAQEDNYYHWHPPEHPLPLEMPD